MSETDSGSSDSTKIDVTNSNKSSDSDNYDTIQWGVVENELDDTDTKNRKVAGMVASHMDEEFDFIAREEDNSLLVYNPDEGVYEHDGETFVSGYIGNNLSFGYYSEQFAQKVIEQLAVKHRVPSDEIGNVERKLCVENMVLDISEPSEPDFEEHTADYPFTTKYPVEYQHGAECSKFKEYLREVVPDKDERMKLQEYAGYCLHHWENKFDEVMLLVGPTDSGKTVFLETISEILGEDNILNQTLQQLCNNRFMASSLPGHVANINNDLSRKGVQNTGLYKQISDGNPIEVEEKNQPSFSYRPTQKQLYSANRVPEVEDEVDAFYNRFLHVRFPKTIPEEEQDRELLNKLTSNEELSGILNWMLEGYARLMEQSGFTAERSIPEKRDLWQSYGDSLDQYISERVVVDSDSEILKDAMYDDFIDFCTENDLQSDIKQNLTKRLQSECGASKGQKPPSEGRKRTYEGVTIVGSDEDSRSNPVKENPF